MQAVILAGGLGTRLRPLTEAIPKPLLPIGERSLIEVQVQLLKKYGVDEIYLATNYKADYVSNFMGDGSRYGIRIKVSCEDKPLGTAGPVRLLSKELIEPFFVINGDILSTVDFGEMYRFANSLDASLCVGIKRIVTPFAFGQVYHDGNLITGIVEKPKIENDILAGIYVMKPEIFDHIPVDQYFGMDQLILTMLKVGAPVSMYMIRAIWLDIGQLPDYEKAQDVYDEHFREDSGA